MPPWNLGSQASWAGGVSDSRAQEGCYLQSLSQHLHCCSSGVLAQGFYLVLVLLVFLIFVVERVLPMSPFPSLRYPPPLGSCPTPVFHSLLFVSRQCLYAKKFFAESRAMSG